LFFGEKEDKIDAEKLAQLAAVVIQRDSSSGRPTRRLRELIMAYHDTNKSIVRVKE